VAQLRSPVLTAIGLVNGKPWEHVIFDPPPTESTYLNQSLKKFVTGDYFHDYCSCAKFGRNPSMVGFGENMWNIKYILFVIYTPFLSNSPTGQTAHHIFTLNGSNDADSCKGVPFLALVDIANHLGDQIAQKPQFWGRE